MQKFRIKVSFFVNALLALCAIVAGYIAATTFITLLKTQNDGIVRILISVALLCLAAFLLALFLSSLIYQYYRINDGKLKMCLGFIVITYSINDISEVIYYKDKRKLVAYYGEDKFTIILLSEEKHEDFIKELRKINPEIIYDNKINEND